jgi:glycosyltransferase involved in cell wall biosynthesis
VGKKSSGKKSQDSMKKLKIAHVIGYFQPEFGYEEYFTALEQARLGHEVHVVCADRIGRFEGIAAKDRRREIGICKINGIIVHRLLTIFEPYGDMIFLKGIKSALKKIAPDIVHGHTLTQLPSVIASLWAKELGYKYFSDHHDFIFQGHHLNPIEKSFKRTVGRFEYLYIRKNLSKLAINRSRKIIAVADVCKQHLMDFHKVPESKIFLNNLAVDTSRFQFKKEKRQSIRKKLGITDEIFLMVFSGIVAPRKRIELFVDVLYQLKSLSVKLLLVVRGDKSKLDKLKGKFFEKGLEQQVRFIENIDSCEMADYYSASDTAVWIGNNSIAILEAMACGLPVVVPQMQLANFVTDNGFLIAKDNVEDCVRAIRELVINLALRGQMAKKSYENVMRHWSYQKSAKNLIELYNNC